MGWLWYHHQCTRLQFRTDVLDNINSNFLDDLFLCSSHFVRGFFSLYINIELSRDLDSHDLAFSLLEVELCTLPELMPLPLPGNIPLLEPTPIPDPPLPLPMAVDCCQSYRPCFLLGQISLNLRCWWSSSIGLGTIINLSVFGGYPLYPSVCNFQIGFSKPYQSINAFTSSPVVLVSVNKPFLSVLRGSWSYLFRSFGAQSVFPRFFMPVIDVSCQLLDNCTVSSGFSYAYFVCRAGCLALVPFFCKSWILCYNQIEYTAILVPLDKF